MGIVSVPVVSKCQVKSNELPTLPESGNWIAHTVLLDDEWLQIFTMA